MMQGRLESEIGGNGNYEDGKLIFNEIGNVRILEIGTRRSLVTILFGISAFLWLDFCI